MNRRRLAWLSCLFFLLFGTVPRAGANWGVAIETLKGSGVDIGCSSPIDHPPTRGYMPCWVTIKNHSGSAHIWTIRASARNGFGSGSGTSESSQSLRVEDDATGRLPILLPLAALSSGATYYRPCTLEVEGYGVARSETGIAPGVWDGAKKPTAFVGMGETLSVPLWEPLKKQYADAGSELIGSPVKVNLLGIDWRGLSGFDALWLTEEEYAGLEPDQQLAIRRWIDLGGNLLLCTQGLDPALRAGLGFATSDTGHDAHPGFGSVRLISWDGKTMPPATASSFIDGIRSARKAYDYDHEATDWGMVRSLGNIPINAPFLICFIAVFAMLVGPVNLFWLANARRRHRLFLTTPAISLAASLLLIVVIVAEDGFGGHGERVMLTLLCPGEKQAVVIQEQAARTGVLLSRQFTASEDLVLSPLQVKHFNGKTYGETGRSYGGDWFASHSVQAHRLEAVVPSRAEIQLLNAEAAKTGAPPVVVSSIPAALKEIHYVDPDGKHWRGGELRTGAQATLQPDKSIPVTNPIPGSTFLFKLQNQASFAPGSFYAVADDGPFLDTLPSIRWRKQLAIYLGPVTNAIP